MPGAVRDRGRVGSGVYLRRRVLVGLLAVTVSCLLISVALGLIGGPSDSAGAEGAARAYVVQPGDTWWSLAHSLERGGDVRDTVAYLIDLNGGEALPAGQSILLPLG